MQDACSCHEMANLQVKNIPDALHERLRRYARENRCTISAAVLAAVERELEMWEWREHMARRPETDLGVDAAALIADERVRRAKQIGSWYPHDHGAEGERQRPGGEDVEGG